MMWHRKGGENMKTYVITDGERFIYRNRQGKYVPTTGEAMADTFHSQKRAESILHNQITKGLRTSFRVECMDEDSDKKIKQLSVKEVQDNSEKVILSEDVRYWIEKLSSLNGISKEVRHRKSELEKGLRNVDNELLDLQHYIEFGKFNASEGYITCVRFKNTRLRRRSIKNEIAVLDIILDESIGGMIVEEIMKRIKELDKRRYNPRVLKELFE